MKRHYPLQKHNTLRVKATADYFCTVCSVPSVQQLIVTPEYSSLPKLILGGGSNILFTRDFPGLIIKNDIHGIELIQESNEHVWLTIGGGENWHNLVLYCINRGYAGIENLSLIPGTVGAAPIQNIGAYGVEIESVLESLEAVNLTTGNIKTFSNKECQFGYRDSIFKRELKNQYIITHVTLKLNKQANLKTHYGEINSLLNEKNITQPTIKDISDIVIHIRNTKLPDPKTLPNAGSFFKNPIISADAFKQLKGKFPDIPHYHQNNKTKIPAAWLIDQCKLKGFKQGNVGISPDHALVIVNYASDDGTHIKKLSETIQKIVADKFGIILKTEVNII